ncbi:MAG TPA: phytase [Acidimicrobiia bacterium]|nr:phytase [Acidimicrobiia bacterium]
MDGATRIWLDDPNPIFRMGLAASLRDSGFVVVGESSGLVPLPDLDGVDVLVFDLGEQALGAAPFGPGLSRRQRRSRLVGLVPGGDAGPTATSQCTVLVRSELTPEGFRDCLASVAAEASAPAPVPVPAATGWRPGAPRARAAWSEAGSRLRSTLRRRGVLFVVAAAFAAGAFGPTGRAEGLDQPPVAAPARAETTPVATAGDAAADVAVWVDAADPSASLVIGTDKRGGAVESYDLKGGRVERIPRAAGAVNGVDVRSGFSLAGQTVTLVATGGRVMSFFRLDPATRRLVDVGARTVATKGVEGALCLYRSGVTGRFYAFLAVPGGDITQYELFDEGGLVDVRAVRRWPLGDAVGGCVADDETGRLFVSGKRTGIYRYNAEPDASPLARTTVDRVGGAGHLTGEVAGLALVTQPGRRGFLLASSRGDNTFAVYRRGLDNAWLGQRQVVAGRAADGCSDTTGIEAVAANLGPDFPAGIFVCRDGDNTPPGSAGNQDFKYVRLEDMIDAGSLPT